jgi:hypothetical protein
VTQPGTGEPPPVEGRVSRIPRTIGPNTRQLDRPPRTGKTSQELPHTAIVSPGQRTAAKPRPTRGMSGVRREALRCIPGVAGKDWRDVLGSDVLPGAERLRGKEHDRKPAAGSRYQGRCAGGPARYGES